MCKNDDTEIVKAGEKLKDSKKKSKMPSAKANTSRDWGKGFACAGRQKVCTIVPQNHFGPVPGVEVGTLWKFRLQVTLVSYFSSLMFMKIIVIQFCMETSLHNCH